VPKSLNGATDQATSPNCFARSRQGERLAPFEPNSLILLDILLGHLPSCLFGGGLSLRRFTLVLSEAPVRGLLDAWNLGRTRATNRSPVD
jgi:hypothetical protein